MYFKKKLKSVLFIAICAITQVMTAQSMSDCEEITATFGAYSACIEEKKYNQAFDYYLDSFLLYIPKDQLMKQLAGINNSDNVTYKVDETKINALSEVIADNRNVKYAYLQYSSVCYYIFKDEASQEYRERIKSMFRDKHPDSYKFNHYSQSISFIKKGELIALKKSIDWKFIIYKDVMIPYMFLWMPEETFSELLVLRKTVSDSTLCN